MADLGTHFAIGDTLTIPFQTRSSTGALADADAVPAYRIYEEGGTTAVTSGNGAKRDDANTTGYYEASVTLLAATGFEVGKSYTIYKTATIGGVAVGSLDTFAITNAGATSIAALSGWPTTTDVETRFDESGLTAPSSNTMNAAINATVTAWERITGFSPFLGDGVDETRYYVPRGGKVIDFGGGLTDAPTSLTVNGNYTDAGVFENGTALVVNRDYTLLPTNALSKGKPYTHARVTRSYPLCYFEWASIKVVAPFGYAETVPADAWEAVMRCVLALLLPSAGVEASGGASTVKQGPVEWQFDANSSISQAISYFEKHEQGVLLGYKMERMNVS